MLKKVIAIVMCASFLLFAVACKSEDQIQQSTQQGNSRHEVVITQEPAEPQNVLKVNGSGEVTAIPDIAEISLAVVTQDKDAAEAERLNNEAMNAVMEALYGFNIEENDIESSYFNLYPMYDYSNNKESITGYRVNNEIRVVVRDVFRYPTYVYVADVNRWGDATLVACVQGVPRPIVVSSRQVSIV